MGEGGGREGGEGRRRGRGEISSCMCGSLVAIFGRACTEAYQHVFRVLCLELGEQQLTVAVGNLPTHKNQYPAKEEANVRSGYPQVISEYSQDTCWYIQDIVFTSYFSECAPYSLTHAKLPPLPCRLHPAPPGMTTPIATHPLTSPSPFLVPCVVWRVSGFGGADI